MEDVPAMKRVLSGSSLPDTAHFQNLLEHAGVPCIIKNRELGGGIGDLPLARDLGARHRCREGRSTDSR
jgi:repressor of nif and glnA expression